MKAISRGLQVADAPLARQSSAASGKPALWRRRIEPSPVGKKPSVCAVVAAALMLPWMGMIVPASAHHAFAAEYDAKKHVILKGTVTKMEWINPHAWIHIDVKKP